MAYTTIDDPGLYFNSVKFTGDVVDGDGTYHDQAVTGVGFEPDLLWHKGVTGARPHYLVDSVRGQGGSPTNMFHLTSSNTEAEITLNTNGHIKSLDSDGWTAVSGNDSSSRANNSCLNGEEYIGWCWKESATAGFDIVSYSGTGSAKTESHSLSAVPHLMIVKNRDSVESWMVYHQKNTSAPETDFLEMEVTNATVDNSNRWNDTAPTSSVFTVGTHGGVNESSAALIAYLWTSVQGFSKFGSYTGNGNADGPFIYTGFRPAYVLIKVTSDASGWTLQDTTRTPFNVSGKRLLANSANAEIVDAAVNIDFLSNGFKIRNNDTDDNGDGRTHIYAAFAEAPFVNSNGVPTTAR